MSNIIVTASDEKYFPLAQGLIRSLRRHAMFADQAIGFIDYGINASQHKWLVEQRAEIKEGRWDFDFPSRPILEKTQPYVRIYLCRVVLRRYFPGHQVYLWMDADTWVQRAEAVEDLLSAAARGDAASVPEIDRSYFKFNTGPQVWEVERQTAVLCLGPVVGNQLYHVPNLNTGVLALRHDAPHWELWRQQVQMGLEQIDATNGAARMIEAVSFTAAVNRHKLPVQRFPCTYNWLACLSTPAWDADRECFVEPAPPHTPIGIMHLTMHLREAPTHLPCIRSGKQVLTLNAPLSFEAWETLVRSRAQLFGAMSSADAQPNGVPVHSAADRDYVSPGLASAQAAPFFPNMTIGNKAACTWPYLRREIPHRWYVDRRTPHVGFLNRDEAHILYNIGLQFRGKRALEIGCWLGWSACHLALAGVVLDVVDPVLQQAEMIASVRDSLRAAGVAGAVNLVAGPSPKAVRELATQNDRKWSLFFVDGNHDHPGPRDDAQVCAEYAEPDAAIVFHDLASPQVTEGLNYLRQQGWQTRVYQTMQIMGIAWRGKVAPLEHVPDPTVRWPIPEHLRLYLSPPAPPPQVAAPALAADFDAEDRELIRLVGPFTMTSPERIVALRQAVEYVVRNEIPGDIVECGVWRGGSMMAIARTLLRLGSGHRSLYLCDTFEGMPPPGEMDRALGGLHASELMAREDRNTGTTWAMAPLDQVRAAMQLVGYDSSRIHFIKGKVEDTLPGAAPKQIALLRLDTDWYESTYHELTTLYPRLVAGGVLIIDDYGHWEGARRAVDQYIAENKLKLLLNRIDYTGRIAVKPN